MAGEEFYRIGGARSPQL